MSNKTSDQTTDQQSSGIPAVWTCEICHEPIASGDPTALLYRGWPVHDDCMRHKTNYTDFDRNPRFDWRISSHDAETVLRALHIQAADGDLAAQRLYTTLGIRLREVNSSVAACALCGRILRVDVAIEGTKTAQEEEITIRMIRKMQANEALGKGRARRVHLFCCKKHDELYANKKYAVPRSTVINLLTSKDPEHRARILASMERIKNVTQPQDATIEEHEETVEETVEEHKETVEEVDAVHDQEEVLRQELLEAHESELADFVIDNLINDEATEATKVANDEIVISTGLFQDDPPISCEEIWKLVVSVYRERKMTLPWKVVEQ